MQEQGRIDSNKGGGKPATELFFFCLVCCAPCDYCLCVAASALPVVFFCVSACVCVLCFLGAITYGHNSSSNCKQLVNHISTAARS